MIGIGYTLVRDKASLEEKGQFIDWCNEHGCTYKSEDGVWTILPPDTDAESKAMVQAEIATLQDYLASTDYMVIKCLERGLDMSIEYPREYVERQNARRRINELREQL